MLLVLLACWPAWRLAYAQAAAPSAHPARPADVREDARQWLEQGRRALRAGDRFAALAAIAQAHRLQPADAEIAQALGDVLVELGAPTGAAEALGARADIGLRSRVAAQRLRWASEMGPGSPDPALRFQHFEQVLAELDALLAEARSATSPDPGLLLRLQRDRAVALRRLERWQAVIEQIDALRQQGDSPLPVYLLQTEADARLALRQPVAARALFEEALSRLEPTERAASAALVRELLRGRLYAEVDAEDFDAAFATVETLLAADPQPFRHDGEQTPRPNAAWLDAQVLAAQVRSYADMPAEAWRRIEPLVRAAPALPWLRDVSAEIAAQHGWPRRAEADIETARSLAPDSFDLRLAQVDSDLRRNRLARAEQRLAALLGPGAGLPRLARVQRDLDARLGPSVRFDAGVQGEEGDALRSPGSGLNGSLRVDSTAFQGWWRLVGFVDHNDARVDDDRKIARNRGGAGVAMRWPDVGLEALAWSQRGALDTGGASITGVWEPDDHWTLRAAAEYHSPDVALRADDAGITANVARAGVRYAWHGSAAIEVEGQAGRYSDGNHRQGWILLGLVRLLERPHLRVSLRPRADWQTNSRIDTPYFSPSHARSASVATEVEHVLRREYERSWLQRAVLEVGRYDQARVGGKGVGGLRYEHTWRHDPRTELTYGVGWSSNVYDGQRENTWRGTLTLQHRFGR